MNDQAYEAASRLVSAEVMCCASYMVQDLTLLVNNADRSVIRELSFDEDDIYNLSYGPRDYEEPVSDHIRDMPRDEVIELLTEGGFECRDEESTADLREALLEYIKGEDELEEFAEDRGIEPYQREIYEHWVVTSWLAHKLEERGEVVVEMMNMRIWGRCTTGQSIAMDDVIQQIATEHLR